MCKQTLLCRQPWPVPETMTLALEMMTMTPKEWTLIVEALRNLPTKVPLVVAEVLSCCNDSALVAAYRRLLYSET